MKLTKQVSKHYLSEELRKGAAMKVVKLPGCSIIVDIVVPNRPSPTVNAI